MLKTNLYSAIKSEDSEALVLLYTEVVFFQLLLLRHLTFHTAV